MALRHASSWFIDASTEWDLETVQPHEQLPYVSRLMSGTPSGGLGLPSAGRQPISGDPYNGSVGSQAHIRGITAWDQTHICLRSHES